MNRLLKLILVLLVTSSLFSGDRLLAGNDNDPPGNPSHGKSPGYGHADPATKNRSRGNEIGNYSVTVAGSFSGTGTALIGSTVSLTVPVVAADGSKGTLAAAGLVLNQNYFKGAGTIMGVTCVICGRVDLPTAQDPEESDQQAITGRITGTFRDATGKVGRIVAVQQVAAITGKS